MSVLTNQLVTTGKFPGFSLVQTIFVRIQAVAATDHWSGKNCNFGYKRTPESIVLGYCNGMAELTPAQRTASTARGLMYAGALFVTEALYRGSAMRAALASAIVAFGAGLLMLAKRAEN